MAGLGIILAWFGYSVAYYGLDTVRGGNDSFMSLIWPGRYAPTARDDGTGGASAKSSNPKPSGGAAQGSLGNFKTCANPVNWVNLKCNVPCILFGKLC